MSSHCRRRDVGERQGVGPEGRGGRDSAKKIPDLAPDPVPDPEQRRFTPLSVMLYKGVNRSISVNIGGDGRGPAISQC